MAFGRIPSSVCDEAVRVQEGGEDFLLKASTAGALEGMKRVAEALINHGDRLQGGDSCPQVSLPVFFTSVSGVHHGDLLFLYIMK